MTQTLLNPTTRTSRNSPVLELRDPSLVGVDHDHASLRAQLKTTTSGTLRHTMQQASTTAPACPHFVAPQDQQKTYTATIVPAVTAPITFHRRFKSPQSAIETVQRHQHALLGVGCIPPPTTLKTTAAPIRMQRI